MSANVADTNETQKRTETMTKTADQIVEEIKMLSTDEIVATNSGTHSLDPQFFTWSVFERLDGTQYTVGDADSGAGYTRKLKYESAMSRRTAIAALQQLLVTAKTEAQKNKNYVESLNRGWDGYQFVGVAEGARRAALVR
jgi:hypothetical protein